MSAAVEFYELCYEAEVRAVYAEHWPQATFKVAAIRAGEVVE